MQKLTNYISNKLMNHLTPIDNIITMVKNLYAEQLEILVEPTEDNKGIILKSSKFKCEHHIDEIVWKPMYHGCSIGEYIIQQGLDKYEIFPVDAENSEFYIKFTAEDLKK